MKAQQLQLNIINKLCITLKYYIIKPASNIKEIKILMAKLHIFIDVY